MLKSIVNRVFGTRHDRERRRVQPIVEAINDQAERLQALVLLVDRVDDGLDAPALPVVTGPEDAVDDGLEHRIGRRNASNGTAPPSG